MHMYPNKLHKMFKNFKRKLNVVDNLFFKEKIFTEIAYVTSSFGPKII